MSFHNHSHSDSYHRSDSNRKRAWSSDWETITKEHDDHEATPKERFEKLRTGVYVPTSPFAKVIFSSNFETFAGIVVVINFFTMTIETNAHAIQDATALEWVKHANRILLIWYCFECFARAYLLRLHFFFGGWNVLDLVIVLTGIFSEIMEASTTGSDGSNLKEIGMLKSLRMLRMLRLVRLLVAFRELYTLIAGIARCMKTLLWASVLIFMVTNLWAILSVEYLRTLAEDLGAEGAFGTCSWCPRAFSNIWLANLTWFSIISGNDWGDLGRPLVESYYYPYVFFIAGVFVIVWGLLNLIVAGIIDANIAAREEDVLSNAKMAARAQAEAWASFESLCHGMDTDRSGTISFKEFENYANESEELRNILTAMGINKSDLHHLLHIMDIDRSGSLDHHEFINQFTLMKTLVMKTSLFYLLKYSERQTLDMEHMRASVNSVCEEVRHLERHLQGMFDQTSQTLPTSTVAYREEVNANRFSSTQSLYSVYSVDSLASDQSLTYDSPLDSQKIATSVAPCTNQKAIETQNMPRLATPVSGLQKDVYNLPGWYYYGNTPPLDASLFWERLGNPSKHQGNLRGDRDKSEWASSLAHARSFCYENRRELFDIRQRLGEDARKADANHAAESPRKTPAAADMCKSSAGTSEDQSGKMNVM